MEKEDTCKRREREEDFSHPLSPGAYRLATKAKEGLSNPVMYIRAPVKICSSIERGPRGQGGKGLASLDSLLLWACRGKTDALLMAGSRAYQVGPNLQ